MTICNCLYEEAEQIKEAGGYEDVFPPVGIISGKAYMMFTVKEYGKKKEKQVPMLLSRCPICGKPYEEREENGIEKEQTIIQKTQMYMENYREMERYIRESVSEVSQIPDIEKYNISAEKAFLNSIRECKTETVILFEHLNKALESLKEEADAAGENYKYETFEAVYIKGKTYQEIVKETGCGKNSPKKWCRTMTERLSLKLFGVKALEDI